MGGLVSSILGKEGTPSQSGVNAMPAWLQNYAKDYGSLVSNTANSTSPYSFVPYSTQGQQAIDLLGKTNNFSATYDFGKRASSMYDTAGNTLASATPYFQQGADLTNAGAQALTSGDIASSISDFYNPYQSQVVDSMSRQIQDKQAADMAAARAKAGSAFGGSRAAIGQSILADQGTKTLGDVIGNLQYQGYQQAANQGLNRLQTERSNMLTAGGQMGQLGNNVVNQGNAQTGLGAQLWNSKMGVNQLANDALARQTQQAQNLILSDTMQRTPTIQNNQIPLQQIQTFQQLFAPFTGTSTGETSGTSGLLGSNGLFNGGGNYFSFLSGQGVR